MNKTNNETATEPTWSITERSTSPSGVVVVHIARLSLVAELRIDAENDAVDVRFLGDEHALTNYARAEAARLAAVAWDYAGDGDAGLLEDGEGVEVDAATLRRGEISISGAAALTLVAVHLGLVALVREVLIAPEED